MPKKVMSDMIVSKKSIRQIAIPKEVKPKIERPTPEYRAKYKIPEVRGNRKPLNPKFVIWLLAVICLIALFFGVSLLFSSATIIVTPRTEKVTFNNELYTAKLNAPSVSTDLSFEVLTVKKTASENVEATEEKEVSQKASGKIIIYNNYSSVSQRLINNTRFESTNGKIYRLNSSVVVPGTKTVAGKVTPGSVEATVVADQAGDSYNLRVDDLTGDFKIPGFKGSPQYNGFYARLKEDIKGGLIGKQKIVDETLRQTTELALKVILKEQLLKELYAITPENYVIFNEAYSIDYTSQPDTSVDENKAKINMEGSLHAVVFNNLKLSKYLATKKLTEFDGLPTELVFGEALATTFKGKDSEQLWRNSSLEVRFNGDADIKWLYDSEGIKKDLAGRKEADLATILAKYRTSVSSIKVVFRPVWTRYFPDNLNRIKVEEQAL